MPMALQFSLGTDPRRSYIDIKSDMTDPIIGPKCLVLTHAYRLNHEFSYVWYTLSMGLAPRLLDIGYLVSIPVMR